MMDSLLEFGAVDIEFENEKPQLKVQQKIVVFFISR